MPTKPRALTGLERVVRCPFCTSRGAGVVAVDVDRVRELTSRRRAHIDVELGVDDPEGVIRFASARGPCRHLVSMFLDVGVCGTDGDEQPLSYSANFDHPWFVADAGSAYNIFLWTETDFGDGDASDYRPRAAHAMLRPGLERRLQEGAGSLVVSGNLIYAWDARRFLDGVRRACDRRQRDVPGTTDGRRRTAR